MITAQIFRSGPDAVLWIHHRWGHGSMTQEKVITEVRVPLPPGTDSRTAVRVLLARALEDLAPAAVERMLDGQLPLWD